MPFLIDGNNVLGAMRVDRHADGPKRELVRMLANFARNRKTRVTCVFDGPEPPSFARHLGSVSIVFSGARSADDLIAERAGSGRGWTVVTSDRALSSRVHRRHVDVMLPAAFVRDLEAASSAEGELPEDWAEYFSDPKNRLKF